MVFKLKTLTPIWTGNVEMKCDRLHETGIIGSIRWWYEALVRGLDGYACDPTDGEGCQFDTKSFQKTGDLEAELQKICPACQMFGCTGWGKKMRWIIDDSTMKNEGNKGRIGHFTIEGIEVKHLKDEELWLLYSVFHIINVYGTIGGKCMLKPSTNRDRGHYCDDRGKVTVDFGDFKKPSVNKKTIKDFFSKQKKEMENNGSKTKTEWPNLKRFFFSPEEALDAAKYKQLFDLCPYRYKKFLKGNKGDRENAAQANKIASFKNFGLPPNSKQKKFWGYTEDENEMYDAVKKKLTVDLELKKIKTGEEVIDEL